MKHINCRDCRIKAVRTFLDDLGYTPVVTKNPYTSLTYTHSNHPPVTRSRHNGKWDRCLGGEDLKSIIRQNYRIIDDQGNVVVPFDKTHISGRNWAFNTIMSDFARHYLSMDPRALGEASKPLTGDERSRPLYKTSRCVESEVA